MEPEIIILAAGAGTRMRSVRPKVLHELAGRPLLWHVLSCAMELAPKAVHVVVGHQHEMVEEAVQSWSAAAGLSPRLWRQEQRLGTAHAVQQALPGVDEGSTVLVLYGDTPLVRPSQLRPLLTALDDPGIALALLSTVVDDPAGYGRIVRGADGELQGIVEHADASAEVLQVREINTGMMCAAASTLRRSLPQLGCGNAQGEYYLTDLASLLTSQGQQVAAVQDPLWEDLMGVNDCRQLAAAERRLQLRQAQALLADGVTLADPHRFDLRGTLEAGRDVFIDVNVVLCGRVRLGDGVRIGAGCVIRDCDIADGVVIHPYSVLEGASIMTGASIGPFARLRPGSELGEGVHVGNFVEIKQSRLGAGTKAGHLSYLGDSTIGRDVNIGAGTITCNYDGASKHRTVIGDGVFVGSDTQLVAPVEIREGVTIGAGTTVTRSLRHAPHDLLLTRASPRVYHNFPRPTPPRK